MRKRYEQRLYRSVGIDRLKDFPHAFRSIMIGAKEGPSRHGGKALLANGGNGRPGGVVGEPLRQCGDGFIDQVPARD